jgi:hypothetical protein
MPIRRRPRGCTAGWKRTAFPRLVGMETPRGKVPRRLTPIFRDRNELPASSDLNEEVRNALAASACLIVLCSPEARRSRWVDQEIRYFREKHPDRPILAGAASR